MSRLVLGNKKINWITYCLILFILAIILLLDLFFHKTLRLLYHYENVPLPRDISKYVSSCSRIYLYLYSFLGIALIVAKDFYFKRNFSIILNTIIFILTIVLFVFYIDWLTLYAFDIGYNI